MARKASIPSQPERPKLRVPRAEAKEKVQAQIDKGEALRNQKEWSSESVMRIREEFYRWDTFNGHLLQSLFTTDQFRDDYHFGYGGGKTYASLNEQVNALIDDIGDSIGKLHNVIDAIDVTDEDEGVRRRPPVSIPSMPEKKVVSNKVFIVHGHDNEAKQEVARLLEKLKLQAIILHEQPNMGRTIIEKFEKNSSDVAFAVILLTPDDLGAAKGEKDTPGLKARARQNVVFEMGFFYAALGRERVCSLLKGNTEQPSDVSGVVYQAMDAAGSWKTELAKEMRAAGLPVDLNLL